MALIQQLEKLIASPKMQREVLTEDLQRVKKLYADPRRSVIVRAWERTEQAPVTVEETEPETQVWVSLLQNGEMAAIPGAKPPVAFGNNPPKFVLYAGSRDILYLFTEKGRAASVPVHVIPNRETPEEGVPFSSVCALEPRSRIIAALVLAPVEEKEDPRSVLMGTRKGMVKKTSVTELPGMSSQVFQAMKVAEEDSVGWVKVLSGKDDILMVTASGMSIRYSEEEIRPTGWATVGVMGIKIAAHDDEVVGVTSILPKEEVLLMAASGQAKRVAWDKFPLQGRYGVGTAAWKTGANLRLCGAEPGKGADRVILVHAGGASKTLNWQDAPLRNRGSGGKTVIKLKPGDRILRILTLMGAGPVIKTAARRKAPARKKVRVAKRKKK